MATHPERIQVRSDKGVMILIGVCGAVVGGRADRKQRWIRPVQ